MTQIDNGSRGHLVIKDVVDGECGISRNKLAFVPNRSGRKPTEARYGMLDGAPIRLTNIETADNGQHFVATFGPMS